MSLIKYNLLQCENKLLYDELRDKRLVDTEDVIETILCKL